MEPAKTKVQVSTVQNQEYLACDIKIPYAAPKIRKPVKTGIVWGKAALRAHIFSAKLLLSFIKIIKLETL